MSEREIERWITVHGVHVPIYKGETEEEVTKRVESMHGEKKEEKPKYKDNLDPDEFIHDNLKQLKAIHDQAHKEGRDGMRAVEDEWRDFRTQEELKHIHEMDIEDAIKTVRASIPPNVHEGWFRSADSEYKPRLVNNILSNPGTLNAGFAIGYYNYRYQFERFSEIEQKWILHEGVDQSKKLSFKDWLITPQTMYRGTHGQSTYDKDVFSAYTPNKRTAEKFLNESAGGKLETIQIRPIDTWGSYQTTTEEEYLVPAKYLRSMKK